jgi:hypothetical protein
MWASSVTASGDDRPTPEQVQQWHRRMSPPENEIPAGVGLTVMLGRSDDAAVGITQFEAFSAGFRFTLAVRVRRLTPELADGRLMMLIGSHVRPGVDIPVERRLLFGLEFADGRRASTVAGRRPPRPGQTADDQRLVLVQHGGGGGQLAVDQTYWVSPLPPDGPLTVVLAWPGFGLPESRTVVDGSAIRAAADRSQLLWPPSPPVEPATPPSPPRPSSGWFADEPG